MIHNWYVFSSSGVKYTRLQLRFESLFKISLSEAKDTTVALFARFSALDALIQVTRDFTGKILVL